MTFLRFLVLWGVTSLAVGFIVGRAIARLRLEGKPCHLVTARQAAETAGVSLAAVRAWERDGLLAAVHCPACGRAAFPVSALRPLLDRSTVDLAAAAPVGAQR